MDDFPTKNRGGARGKDLTSKTRMGNGSMMSHAQPDGVCCFVNLDTCAGVGERVRALRKSC